MSYHKANKSVTESIRDITLGVINIARPVKNELEEFITKLDAFMSYCDTNDVDPTDYQLIKFLNISPRTLMRYRASDRDDNKTDNSDDTGDVSEENRTYKGFGTALKKIDLFREDFAIRQVKENPKLTGHVAMKLKQQHWGGWVDTAKDENKSQEIHIHLGLDASKTE
jgi:hypothetical protein